MTVFRSCWTLLSEAVVEGSNPFRPMEQRQNPDEVEILPFYMLQNPDELASRDFVCMDKVSD
jgi:hypothetical protein